MPSRGFCYLTPISKRPHPILPSSLVPSPHIPPPHTPAPNHPIYITPQAFKFVFGMVNDCFPLWGGYRRKPYMVMGWLCCCLTLFALSTQGLPPPYWCVDNVTGEFITTMTDEHNKTVPSPPCHPATSEEGGSFAMWMCFAAFGYVIADVAADGLTVEYARREPEEKRGTTQSTV